eukprot:9485602-Pyramimonas_sp.AAC.1
MGAPSARTRASRPKARPTPREAASWRRSSPPAMTGPPGRPPSPSGPNRGASCLRRGGGGS